MPVANRVFGSAYERDEQIGLAMIEHAGIEAYNRGESLLSNPEAPDSNAGKMWNLGWRRAQFLATGGKP